MSTPSIFRTENLFWTPDATGKNMIWTDIPTELVATVGITMPLSEMSRETTPPVLFKTIDLAAINNVNAAYDAYVAASETNKPSLQAIYVKQQGIVKTLLITYIHLFFFCHNPYNEYAANIQCVYGIRCIYRDRDIVSAIIYLEDLGSNFISLHDALVQYWFSLQHIAHDIVPIILGTIRQFIVCNLSHNNLRTGHIFLILDTARRCCRPVICNFVVACHLTPNEIKTKNPCVTFFSPLGAPEMWDLKRFASDLLIDLTHDISTPPVTWISSAFLEETLDFAHRCRYPNNQYYVENRFLFWWYCKQITMWIYLNGAPPLKEIEKVIADTQKYISEHGEDEPRLFLTPLSGPPKYTPRSESAKITIISITSAPLSATTCTSIPAASTSSTSTSTTTSVEPITPTLLAAIEQAAALPLSPVSPPTFEQSLLSPSLFSPSLSPPSDMMP